MYEQLDIFSFLEPQERKEFNPIEEYAKHGSGFCGGKKRIFGFFKNNNSVTDRENFLKKEYGIGGFGIPCEESFVVHGGRSSGKGCEIEYYNENMENVKIFVSYKQLAETIESMIERGIYEQAALPE